MFARLGRARPAPDTDVIMRTVAALTLAALAVIHVVDLPGTLGPDRLVGIGYLGIAALSVETLIILLATGWAWQARVGAARGAEGRRSAPRSSVPGPGAPDPRAPEYSRPR